VLVYLSERALKLASPKLGSDEARVFCDIQQVRGPREGERAIKGSGCSEKGEHVRLIDGSHHAHTQEKLFADYRIESLANNSILFEASQIARTPPPPWISHHNPYPSNAFPHHN
jgi:hypothetical protein